MIYLKTWEARSILRKGNPDERRDGAYGEIFIRRVRSIGIRDRPTSPRSPWQNAYAETVDRLDPQGMPRSYRGVRRTPSAPCAAVLHGLL
jgi:hypothetical protein